MSPRTFLIGAALLAALPPAASPATPGQPTEAVPVAARWEKHELQFTYHGFTSYYTCDGLENKVRLILVHFGARKDARVQATGCPYGPDAPSPSAWVTVAFESLAEAGDSVGDAVAASWQTVELGPRRPYFMGDGECELIEQLKPLLSAGFALQGVEYRTRCVPHQISFGDYSVRGKVLMPEPAR